MVGDFLVFAESEDASRKRSTPPNGESLAEVDDLRACASDAPDGSLADVYVDVGALIEQAGGEVDAAGR